MARTNEEKSLLKKLADGILDGMVGDERVYHGYKDILTNECKEYSAPLHTSINFLKYYASVLKPSCICA